MFVCSYVSLVLCIYGSVYICVVHLRTEIVKMEVDLPRKQMSERPPPNGGILNSENYYPRWLFAATRGILVRSWVRSNSCSHYVMCWTVSENSEDGGGSPPQTNE